jgi:hypothetical protein
MARLTRKNIKVFAGNATNNGVFGSLQASDPVTTTDVETIQSLSAWGEGWNSATVTGEKLPPLEEFQGVQYVTTYQQAYLMQEGMPEWAASVTYYKGCLAKEVTSTGFRIYNSLTNDNTGNMLSDTSNWKKIMDSDDLYAFDNTVVHRMGSETVAGVKTFTDIPVISRGNPYLVMGSTTAIKGTNPASRVTWNISLGSGSSSNASSSLGRFEVDLNRDGTTTAGIYAYENVANSTNRGGIGISYDLQGNIVTSAPAPSDTTSTSSNEIVTVGSLNTVGNYNLVHRTGDETISGVKDFSDGLKSSSIDVFPKTGESNCIIDFHGGGDSQYTSRIIENATGQLLFNCNYVKVPTPTEDNTTSEQADSVGARNTKINSVLSALYPIGSIYIGTQSTCPLATLIAGSTWELVTANKSLWTGDGTNANTSIAAGLPNHTHGFGRQAGDNRGNFVWNNQNEDYILGSQAGSVYWNGSGSSTGTGSLPAGSSMNDKLGFNYTLSTSLAKTDDLASDGVYGNSTTVQPPAYVVNVWRRTA